MATSKKRYALLAARSLQPLCFSRVGCSELAHGKVMQSASSGE